MPHFSATWAHLPDFPFELEGVQFLYRAQSVIHPQIALMGVRVPRDRYFCLYHITRPQGHLFKAEKSTRPIPIGVLQRVLGLLTRYCGGVGGNLNAQGYVESPYLLEVAQLAHLEKFHLEIGFGSGVHLLQKAQSNPAQVYVGVEIHTPSIEQVLRHIELLGLQNLYLVRADARALLEVLGAQCCLGVDLHFPIPWEKNPTRRVMSAGVLGHILRVLVEQGVFWLRTDSLAYFKQSLDLALDLPTCACQIAKNAPAPISSKYEARWLKQHREIYDLRLHAGSLACTHPPASKLCLEEVFYLRGAPRSLTFVLEQRFRRGVDYFLHIQDVLEYAQVWVLVLSFGDFHTPTNKIVVWDRKNGVLEYVGGAPLNTQANVLAHRQLEDILVEAL